MEECKIVHQEFQKLKSRQLPAPAEQVVASATSAMSDVCLDDRFLHTTRESGRAYFAARPLEDSAWVRWLLRASEIHEQAYYLGFRV